ncbi:ORF6C domain-containing protein [Enterococcus raffinosus]|uniref:ORF6C domain-containing protein n=1 Tax=Enterococcus raffinosus TaxID=71452 RepID=UPI0028FD724E|nr:hypothetical protein NUITMVRE36_25770 [Enterococcus raffinosus]
MIENLQLSSNGAIDKGLGAISFTMQRQDEQSKAIQQMIGEIYNTRNEVKEIETNLKKDIQKMNDRIFLDESEVLEVKSEVYKKATILTKGYFKRANNGVELRVSSNLLLSKMGQIRGRVWDKLKKEFHVRKYVNIRHKDFENALEFVKELDLSDFKYYEMRMTPKQLEIIELEKGNKNHE